MGFLGADTEALRGQARATRQCGRTLLERTSTLSSIVLPVQWTGPDADELRRRWSAVERRLRDAAETLDERAQELAEHADEQDRASSADGDGRSVRNRLGLPELPSMPTLVHDIAGPVSDLLGVVRQLAGGVVPSLPGSGNSLLAGLSPGGSGLGGRGLGDLSALSAALGDPSILDLVNGPKHTGPPAARYSGDYDNPEDEFDVTPGEGGKETTKTLSLGGRSVETTTDADGNISTKVGITKDLVDAKAGGGPVSVELDAKITTSGETKDNGDGTVTYTMSAELTAEAKAALKAKGGPVSVSAESSEGLGGSTTYSVTVPEGTPVEQALTINPFDPTSIPAGATVTFDAAASRTSSDSVGLGTSGIDLVTITGTDTTEKGYSTSVGRNADGTLQVTTGPTDKMVESGQVQLGLDKANVHLGSETTKTDTVFEKATFTDDPAGHAAYKDALMRHRFPDDAGDGVVSTYTERHQSEVKDSKEGWELGSASSESTQNMTRHDSITRTYPDGHEESAEQWLPMGDQSTNAVVKSSASDRPSTYSIQLDNSIDTGAYVQDSAYERHYGVTPGERAGIMLTEQEADQIRDNIAGKGAVPTDWGTGETLSKIMNDNHDSDAGIDDLASGYNRNPDGSVDATKTAPGTPYSPASQAVRDGKVVDTAAPSVRPGLQP